MNFGSVLYVLVLFAVYGLVFWGLTSVLRKLGVPAEGAIILSFLVFAVAAGVWATQIWPLETAGMVNLPAVLFGDALYQWSIRYLGEPSSSQAHYSIPWLLRIPQVYGIASIILWGLLGMAIQLIHNRRRQRGMKSL